MNLWFDLERVHYYLIPNEAALPEGHDVTLYSLSGEVKRTDRQTISPWLTSQGEVKDYLTTATQSSMLKWGQVVFSWLTELQSESSASDNEADSAASTAGDEVHFWGLPAAELAGHPQRASIIARRIFMLLSDIFTHVLAGSPQELAMAQQKVHELRIRLAEQKLPLPAQIDRLPQKLHEFYLTMPDPEAFRKLILQLQLYAQELERPVEEGGITWEQLWGRIRTNSGMFPEIDPPETFEERQLRYQKMAHETVEKAFGEKPRFTFKKPG